MLLMSRHLSDYHIVPAGAIIRINLAWEPSIKKLEEHINELTNHIFLDVSFGRKKPPNYKHGIDDILRVVKTNPNVRYLGISQVEHSEDLMMWIAKTQGSVNVVPKIESMKGIDNIQEICKVLTSPKIIMLDHDDLFQDLCASYQHPERMYEDWIIPLIEKCDKMNIGVLRTAGVVFIDK